MARVHFIVDSIVNESLGVMCLSSYLKAHGHRTALTVLGMHRRMDGVLAEIAASRPDLVAFSVMTPQAETYERASRTIREKTRLPVIWGGVHCTLMPEVVTDSGCADILCRGDGEEALRTLADRLDAGRDYGDVPNLWVRRGSEWVRNDLAPLEQDLDRFPFPDRELFYEKSPLLRNMTAKRFLAQRGCPFGCGYCAEPALRELYRGKGAWLRRPSVDYVLRQIEETVRRYPTRSVAISDDTFNLDRAWTEEFLAEYGRRVRLPFCCNLYVPAVDEDLVARLKQAGCTGVLFGVESSVERLRNGILNKKTRLEDYTRAAALLRKHGIRFAVNNMVCLPTQTLDEALDTVRFTRELGAYIIRMYVLKLYKGTPLAETALASGLCREEGPFTYVAVDPHGEHDSMRKLVWLGHYFFRFPWLMRWARPLLRGRRSLLLKPLIVAIYLRDTRFYHLRPWESWRFFRAQPKLFWEGVGGEQPRA